MIKLIQKLEDFLNQKCFKLEEIKDKGYILIYEFADLLLLIDEDYNKSKSIDLKRNGVSSNWLELTLLRSYILKNEDYLKPLSFEKESSFFIDYFDKLLEILNDKSYQATLSALDIMKKNRVRVRYGPR